MNVPTSGVPVIVLAAISWIVGAGCGGSRATVSTTEATVKGTVIVAGKPLGGGKVIFDSATGPREATIAKDGTYSLTTTVGRSSVGLQVPNGFKSSAVANYTSLCEVEAGQENEFNINLTSKGREK